MINNTTPLSAVQQYIEKNYKHNFIVNALDGACFWFGYSFISPVIILPLYLSHFTDNPILIGLIATINSTFFLLPQLFVANAIGRAPVKKFFPVTLGFFLERVPIFLLVPSALLFATNNPTMALISFFFLYMWHALGAGFVIVGWQDMIAKIIPVDRRGRFFGITNFLGNGSGILGAIAVPFVLDRTEFPNGFVMAFAAASVLIFLSWVFLAQSREPAVPSSKPRVSQLEYFRSLPSIVRRDRNFLRYIIFTVINAVGMMANGFIVVYAAQRWNLPDSEAGAFVVAMQIGQALSNLFLGPIADKFGHKINLEVGALLNAVSFGLVVIAPDPLWFFPVFFLRGTILACSMISGISIVMEFSDPEDRPTYIGMANTIPGIASSIAPMIGGALAGAAGYNWLFILSGTIAALALVFLRTSVVDPRKIHRPEPIPAAAGDPAPPLQ
ncbi:MAG: MFS transporter [Chloroflexi bacterium]|nr:MFS transporter [Chloroflexota bacterium]